MKRSKKTLALSLAILFSIVFAVLYKWGQTGNPFKAETVLYGTIILLNFLITGGLAYAAFKKFAKRTPIQLKKSILPALVLFILLALLSSLTIVSIGVYSFYLLKGYDTSNFLHDLFKVELISAVKQFAIWILIGSMFFFYIIWRKSVEREQLLREENLKYKYRNLKSQVNPHFLFNSLNTLSELVYNDAKKADDYIQKLSVIYRYILENEETDLISLKDELDFIQQYFNLQKVRDNDKIRMEIDVQHEDEYKIIPVSLQVLVENALKHNAISRESPLTIRIFTTEDHIVVSNKIQRKNTLENSTQLGLLNLRERVRLIMGKELIINDDTKEFMVKLPLIRLPK